MSLICGVDGCRAGWVAIIKDLDSGDISPRLYPTVQDLVISQPSLQAIAIDIPIGFTERGPRACDQEARKLLGRGRAASVFPAPIRPVLDASGYAEACQIRFREEGKKMSIQAWAIAPKVREVDTLLRRKAKFQELFYEVHPEVSFFYMAGGKSMRHSKKKKAGREERGKLLAPIFGKWLHNAMAERKALSSAADDILDAFAALWTAERIVSGSALTLPHMPPKDAFGLRMEIVA